MSRIELHEPHETRMLALEMAIVFINGDKAKQTYTAEDVIRTSKKFEAYLTETPIDGYDVAEQIADAPDDGPKR